MEDYQTRVVEEADELDKKIEKLEAFTKNLFFCGLPAPEAGRMLRQLDAMRLYSYILHNRIKHFL